MHNTEFRTIAKPLQILLCTPFFWRHPHEFTEVAIERLFAGKARLLGNGDEFRVWSLLHQRLGIVHTHTVDVIGEGAAVFCVYISGNVCATHAQPLSHNGSYRKLGFAGS